MFLLGSAIFGGYSIFRKGSKSDVQVNQAPKPVGTSKVFYEISALSKYAIFKPSQRLDEPEAANKCVIRKKMYHLDLNKRPERKKHIYRRTNEYK